MHLVITEALCVTNEKFNETPFMDEQPGPRPQTDYEISYFLSQHGVFFLITQYERSQNPLISWAPQLHYRAQPTPLRSYLEWQIKSGKKHMYAIYYSCEPYGCFTFLSRSSKSRTTCTEQNYMRKNGKLELMFSTHSVLSVQLSYY